VIPLEIEKLFTWPVRNCASGNRRQQISAKDGITDLVRMGNPAVIQRIIIQQGPVNIIGISTNLDSKFIVAQVKARSIPF